MSLKKVLGGIVTLVAAAAAVVGTLIAANVTWDDFTDAMWPGGAVVALTVVILLLVVELIAERRKIDTGGDPPGNAAEQARADARRQADQEHLDDTLRVLNRGAMNVIDSNDFGVSWPETMTDPVIVFLEQFASIENQFHDPVLESARAVLYRAANEFADAEATNGWQSNHRDGRRNIGYSWSEAEGIPEREDLLEGRQNALLEASREFRRAHEAFLTTARAHDFNIEAVRGKERDPRVQQLNDARSGGGRA